MGRDARWPARFEGHDYPQAIPEPDDIHPGGPAPWSSLPASARSGLDIGLVEARLLDGRRHVSTSPIPVDSGATVTGGDAVRRPIASQSAVLVALFAFAVEVVTQLPLPTGGQLGVLAKKVLGSSTIDVLPERMMAGVKPDDSWLSAQDLLDKKKAFERARQSAIEQNHEGPLEEVNQLLSELA